MKGAKIYIDSTLCTTVPITVVEDQWNVITCDAGPITGSTVKIEAVGGSIKLDLCGIKVYLWPCPLG